MYLAGCEYVLSDALRRRACGKWLCWVSPAGWAPLALARHKFIVFSQGLELGRWRKEHSGRHPGRAGNGQGKSWEPPYWKLKSRKDGSSVGYVQSASQAASVRLINQVLLLSKGVKYWVRSINELRKCFKEKLLVKCVKSKVREVRMPYLFNSDAQLIYLVREYLAWMLPFQRLFIWLLIFSSVYLFIEFHYFRLISGLVILARKNSGNRKWDCLGMCEVRWIWKIIFLEYCLNDPYHTLRALLLS